MNEGIQQQQQSNPQTPVRYEFSSEEIRVLKECNIESFYQRSLPVSTFLGCSAYFGVRQGFLSGNAKYGAVPKVVVGVIAGYIIGKLSYQTKCAEKMMKLPNSKIGQLLRQRKQGSSFTTPGFSSDLTTPFGGSLSGFDLDTNQQDIFPDSQSNSMELDVTVPLFESNIDDSYKSNYDNNSEPPVPVEPSISYEKLRQKNRENYYKSPRDIDRHFPTSPPSNPLNEPSSQRNEYNDTFFK